MSIRDIDGDIDGNIDMDTDENMGLGYWYGEILIDRSADIIGVVNFWWILRKCVMREGIPIAPALWIERILYSTYNVPTYLS